MIIIGLVVGSLLIFPSYLVQHSLKATGTATLEPPDRLRAENDARSTLLQGVAGLVLVVGAVATWRQIQINRQGQFTERFNKAIAQLGESDLARLDIRLGGIYALERLSNHSKDDRATIVELLTGFVCSHALWTAPDGNVDLPHEPQLVLAELRIRAPDIQAAMTVLGRRDLPFGRAPSLLLSGVDLRKADLANANLEGANLDGAHLEGANLANANLEGANLDGANLEGANLTRAKLVRANLTCANLREATLFSARLKGAFIHETNLENVDLRDAHLKDKELPGADLRDSDLSYAHLDYANLTDANLARTNFTGARLKKAILIAAHLEGASLYGAYLKDAHLEGAMADKRTRWPDGFDWLAAGVIVSSEDGEATPP